jgi:hypothetical protein
MKFGNQFWLILFREYINPKLFAVWGKCWWTESYTRQNRLCLRYMVNTACIVPWEPGWGWCRFSHPPTQRASWQKDSQPSIWFPPFQENLYKSVVSFSLLTESSPPLKFVEYYCKHILNFACCIWGTIIWRTLTTVFILIAAAHRGSNPGPA